MAGRFARLFARPERSLPEVEFDNSFEVPLPPAEAWPVLMDIRRIAPCMPGAELTEVVDDKTYKGRIGVRLGPVALTFAGMVTFEEIDNLNHHARVKAQGTDAKGRGGANAAASFRVEPITGGSKVLVHTDLSLSGAVAQYGRGVGMIQATAAQIINQFAGNLKAQLAAAPAASAATGASAAAASASAVPPSAAPPPPAKPISGFSLMAKVLWDALVRLFKGAAKTQ
jgi:carbon monoxide dehydrogenase subunit G